MRHETQAVHDETRVLDFLSLEFIDHHSPHAHILSGCRDSHKLALLGAGPLEPRDDFRSFGNLILDFPIKVRKRFPHTTQNVFKAFKTGFLAGKGNVFNVVFVNKVSDRIEVALVDDLVDELANDFLVPFGHRLIRMALREADLVFLEGRYVELEISNEEEKVDRTASHRILFNLQLSTNNYSPTTMASDEELERLEPVTFNDLPTELVDRILLFLPERALAEKVALLSKSLNLRAVDALEQRIASYSPQRLANLIQKRKRIINLELRAVKRGDWSLDRVQDTVRSAIKLGFNDTRISRLFLANCPS